MTTACACAAAGLSVLAVLSYSRLSFLDFRHHDMQWEVVLHRGCIRVDNQPELDFQRRDLGRLQSIVDARARAYLATMLDGPNLESRAPIELSQAAQGVTASQNYAGAKRELAYWKQVYVAKPVSHSLHLGIPIAILLLPSFRQLLILVRGRRRAQCGLCVGCGYDIRATLDRCPECGRVIPPRPRPEYNSAQAPVPDFVPPSALG